MVALMAGWKAMKMVGHSEYWMAGWLDGTWVVCLVVKTVDELDGKTVESWVIWTADRWGAMWAAWSIYLKVELLGAKKVAQWDFGMVDCSAVMMVVCWDVW